MSDQGLNTVLPLELVQPRIKYGSSTNLVYKFEQYWIPILAIVFVVHNCVKSPLNGCISIFWYSIKLLPQNLRCPGGLFLYDHIHLALEIDEELHEHENNLS